MHDKMESEHSNLKHNPFGFSIKSGFALLHHLCHTNGISRISILRSTMSRSRLPESEHRPTPSTTSNIYNCPEHLKGQLTLGDFNA